MHSGSSPVCMALLFIPLFSARGGSTAGPMSPSLLVPVAVMFGRFSSSRHDRSKRPSSPLSHYHVSDAISPSKSLKNIWNHQKNPLPLYRQNRTTGSSRQTNNNINN